MGSELVCWLLAWFVRLTPKPLGRMLVLAVHARRCAVGHHLMQRPRLEKAIAGEPKLNGRVSRCGLCGRHEMQAEDFAQALSR